MRQVAASRARPRRCRLSPTAADCEGGWKHLKKASNADASGFDQYFRRRLFVQRLSVVAHVETWDRLVREVVPLTPADAPWNALGQAMLSGGWSAIRTIVPVAVLAPLRSAVEQWQVDTGLPDAWCAVVAVATAERIVKLGEHGLPLTAGTSRSDPGDTEPPSSPADLVHRMAIAIGEPITTDEASAQ